MSQSVLRLCRLVPRRTRSLRVHRLPPKIQAALTAWILRILINPGETRAAREGRPGTLRRVGCDS